MILVNRLRRLIAADVHAVLDRIEEPEAVLKQAVRDMAAAIEAGEAQLEQRRAGAQSHRHRLTELEASLESLERKLDHSLERDDESLARTLVRRKLEALRLRDRLRLAAAALDEECEMLAGRLARQQAELDALQQRAASPVAGTPVDTGTVASDAIDETDIEIALLAARRQREAL